METSSMVTFWSTRHFPESTSISSPSNTVIFPLPLHTESTCQWQHLEFDTCKLAHPAGRNARSYTEFPSFVNQGSQESPSLRYHHLSNVYPSPPSTGSSSKYTVPLPEENDDFIPIFSSQPAVMFNPSPSSAVCVKDRIDGPLTPPPSSTHTAVSLPEEDEMLFEYEEEQDESMSELPRAGEDERQNGASLHASSSYHQLLSPLSPTWGTHHMRTSDISDLDERPAYDALSSDPFCPPLWPPPSSEEMDEDSPFLSLDNDDDPTDHFPSLSEPFDVPSQLLGFYSPRPVLKPLAIPWSRSSSPSHSLPTLSPSSHDPPMEYPDSLLSSPSISYLSLPDMDDETQPQPPPASPCRRSWSSLPELDMGMDIDHGDIPYPSPVSPGQTLLSLPGADTDDELLPPPSIHMQTPFPIPPTPSQPLLFVDDPRDVPLPRSPSPEDFDLIFPSDVADPELVQLCDLRKRALAAERSARRLEAALDPVDLALRTEARRARKKEKERSKEVGALLRLKLGFDSGSPPKVSRKAPGSMYQLIAQMVLRRNETVRPLTRRRGCATPNDYTRSPLSTSYVANPIVDMNDADVISDIF